jgi:hypothetical protein
LIFDLVRASAISIVLAACSYPSYGEADGLPSVEFLDHMSTAIVVGVGTLTSTNPSSPKIQIVPLRIIKGEGLAINKPLEIEIEVKSLGCTFTSAQSQPETAIWFLTTHPDGTLGFSFSPKSQSCHPTRSDFETSAAPLPSKWVYPETLDPKDKLGYEFASSIESLHGHGPFSLIMNSQLLIGVSKKSGKDIFSKLAASDDVNTRMIGLSGLLSQGDIPTLHYVSANLADLEHTPAVTYYIQNNDRWPITHGGNGDHVATQAPAIAQSLSGITNPANTVVRELAKILQNTSDQSIRYASAKALQNLHSALATIYLGALLDDDDPEMRAFAIGGLSCFANGSPVIDQHHGPSLSGASAFKTEETLDHFAMGRQTIEKREPYFLDYWRSWWSANGASITAKARS